MLLYCVNAFGNCAPGDEIEVPDDALFDTAYFSRDAPKPVKKVAKKADAKEGNK